MLTSLRGPLTPREGAGSLPVLLLDRGQLPPQPPSALPWAGARRRNRVHGTKKERSGTKHILEHADRGRRNEYVQDDRKNRGGDVPRGVRCGHYRDRTHRVYSWWAGSSCHSSSEQHAAGNRRSALVDGRRVGRRSRGSDVPDPEATQ